MSGHVHTHNHVHHHDHDHSHAHHHDHDLHHEQIDPNDPQARNVALLTYMVAHNKAHADELRDLMGALDEHSAEHISKAVELFDQGNAELEHALNELVGE